MKGYIYNTNNSQMVYVIDGVNNSDIEHKAERLGYMGADEYGLSYTANGLIDDLSAEEAAVKLGYWGNKHA